jgi:lipopolysaccharide biosynthesis glycosyltransferase
MDILFCFDEKYEQHFGVAVTSLLLNHLHESLTIHILTNITSSEFPKKIHQLKNKFKKSEFVVYEVDNQQVANLKGSFHLSLAACYRLLVDSYLPKHLNKVLYLDSDLVVNASLVELYNYDISDYVVAAYCGEGKAIDTKKRIGMNGDYYFNSGVMLINLETWRNLNVGEKCIEFIRDYPEIAILLDQDALNKVIDGRCLQIDKKWNSLVNLYSGTSQANEESLVIHFIGSLKPWHSWCIRKEKNIYWSYLKKSPWSNSAPELPDNFKQALAAIKSIFIQMKNSSK